MNKSNYVTSPNARYVKPEYACEVVSLGRTKLMELAKKENCIKYFGRVARIDLPKLLKAFENY